MTEHKSLLIGFAFSLTPDGSPGKYNQAIAERIKQDITNSEANTWVSMQWEIYDALIDLYQEEGSPLPFILTDKSLVATPPLFAPDDIVALDTFVSSIYSNTSLPWSKLRDHLAAVAQSIGYKDLGAVLTLNDDLKRWALAAQLNALLRERQFYKEFVGTVKLIPLSRKGQHGDWNEERVMPDLAEARYADGLRRFQAQRINRLIIEAIVPESQLRRGRYLSTRGVLDQVIGEIGGSGRDLSQVRIYGHPAHSPRCRRQFLEYIWNHGWLLDPQHVVIDGLKKFWDDGTAQDWCKSPEAWEKYENDPERLK